MPAPESVQHVRVVADTATKAPLDTARDAVRSGPLLCARLAASSPLRPAVPGNAPRTGPSATVWQASSPGAGYLARALDTEGCPHWTTHSTMSAPFIWSSADMRYIEVSPQ